MLNFSLTRMDTIHPVSSQLVKVKTIQLMAKQHHTEQPQQQSMTMESAAHTAFARHKRNTGTNKK